MPRQTTQMITCGIGAVLLMALAGCSGMEGGVGSSSRAKAKASTPKPKDGELALPGDYKSWPRFLSEVQRPDASRFVSSTSIQPVQRRLAARRSPPARLW